MNNLIRVAQAMRRGEITEKEAARRMVLELEYLGEQNHYYDIQWLCRVLAKEETED